MIENNPIENKFKKLVKLYNKISISKQIAIGIAIIMMLTVALISFSLIIQIRNIHGYQLQLPGNFYTITNINAMNQISCGTESLILDVLDLRRSLLNIIRSGLIDENFKILNKYDINNQDHSPSKNCLHNINSSQSIFNCSMNSYIDLLLEQSNIFIPSRPLKRFNIYYQNNDNSSDIMVKSLSKELLDHINQTTVLQRMDSVNEGYFMVSSFYQDQYSNDNKNLTIAYRTKLIFPNYTVLLQAQSYGFFIFNSVTKVLYSNASNTIILQRTTQNQLGYVVLSSLTDLNPILNYSQYLVPGFYETKLAQNQIIYSYSQTFSNIYKINEKINKPSNLITKNSGDFIIVVYSQSLTKKVQDNINQFIDTTYFNGVQFISVCLIVIFCIILLITIITTRQIKKGICCAQNGIHLYTAQPQNYSEVLQSLLTFQSNVRIFQQVIRSIYQTIKIIQYKKQKFRKNIWKFDELPMNWLEQGFVGRQNIKDFQKLQNIKKELQIRHSLLQQQQQQQ